MESEPTRMSDAHARAHCIDCDHEVVRLRRRIKAVDTRLAALERRFPPDCDVESVEMYLAGCLDEDGRDTIEAFMDRYPVLAEYGALSIRRALLERVLLARIRRLMLAAKIAVAAATADDAN